MSPTIPQPRKTMTYRLLLFLCLVLAAGSPSPAHATQDAAAGLIYGTVTWPDGEQLTGFIRWKNEEACWDDLFHCGYRDNPWEDYLDMEQLRKEHRREYFANHGLIDRLLYSRNEKDQDVLGWRMFLIRVGDLQSIEIHDGEDDFAITADGSRHQIGGYGNDAGANLLVYTGEGDPTAIKWNDLSSITFQPVPEGAVPYAERMYGTVESQEGEFTGFIQWDLTECLSSDILDGRLNGKNRDYTMGEIRSLARAAKENATVIELKDGTSVTMGGSNDLDSGNRGIMIETPDLGRVVVPWTRFIKVTFVEGHGTGNGRGTYQNQGPLQGTVTTTEGRRHSGRIIYDLDEGWQWDIFNGSQNGLDYNIPFSLIRSISPQDEETCEVTLHGGQVLVLSGEQDTGKKHGGVLVIPAVGGDSVQLLWDEVQEVSLTP
jgi:hypothetical protein